MNFRIRYFFTFSFIFELFLFSFTLYISIGTSLSLYKKLSATNILTESPSSIYSVFQFVIMFAVATLLLYIILKYYKKAWVIQALFYLAIIEGLFVFSYAYFEWPYFIYMMVFLLGSLFIYKNVLAHNVIIIFVITAIASIFGLNFEPNSVVVILILLAIYDYWAVYKTKHMVTMFKQIAEKKIHFAIIIPHDLKGLFKKIKDVHPSVDFMFLGTGDIALPAILVVSALKVSVSASLWTILGAMGGFILLFILFTGQVKRKPMPGLPPIVLGTILGYLVSFIV